MDTRQRTFIAWAIGTAFGIALPGAASAQDMMKPEKGESTSEKDETKSASKTKSVTKLYRYKGEKASRLLVEDMHTRRSDSLAVPEDESAATAVRDALKEIEPGTPVEVVTERQKGRSVVTGISKAKLVEGEDRPNIYVLVDWDRKKQPDGKPLMAVKLRKLGREVTVMVPLTLQGEEWVPPGSIDYALNRVERGTAIEAFFKAPGPKGGPHLVTGLYEYRAPEVGKFIEFTQRDLGDGRTAAAFRVLAKDGTTLLVTLPGVDRTVNGTKFIQPDPKQLRTVQAIKPDSEVEIVFQPGRDNYMLREIKVLKAPAKS